MAWGTSRKLNAVISKVINTDVTSAVATAFSSQTEAKLLKVVANIADPPTLEDLVSAFGTAASHAATGKSTVVGTIKDNSGGEKEYLVWTDGTDYYYEEGTKAVTAG